MGFVGIDFGTTNSAVAIADDDGGVQLVPLIADLAAIDGVLDDVLARAG